MHARLPRLTSRRLILLAGVALVAVGVLCLYLSDAVARTGSWWQGTLDAFGVGFVVGGIVDVTTISLLNQLLGGTGQQLKSLNRQAQHLLDEYAEEPLLHWVDAIQEIGSFIEDHGDAIDPVLRGRLVGVQQRHRERHAQELRRKALEATESGEWIP